MNTHVHSTRNTLATAVLFVCTFLVMAVTLSPATDAGAANLFDRLHTTVRIDTTESGPGHNVEMHTVLTDSSSSSSAFTWTSSKSGTVDANCGASTNGFQFTGVGSGKGSFTTYSAVSSPDPALLGLRAGDNVQIDAVANGTFPAWVTVLDCHPSRDARYIERDAPALAPVFVSTSLGNLLGAPRGTTYSAQYATVTTTDYGRITTLVTVTSCVEVCR